MLRKSKWWTQLGRGGACDHVLATRLQQRDVVYETSSRTSLQVRTTRTTTPGFNTTMVFLWLWPHNHNQTTTMDLTTMDCFGLCS